MGKPVRRLWFRTIVVVYLVIYFVAVFSNNFVLMTITKPGATILAYYAFVKILSYSSVYNKAINLIKVSFLVWVIIDIISAIGELTLYHLKMDASFFLNTEALLYFGVRVIILAAAIQFYNSLTVEYNRFQRFADLFTIICCVFSSLWILFFAKDTSVSINLLLSLNYNFIFSEIFKLVSMLTLGVLLISWFHYQHNLITFGQRYVLSGLAIMAGMDLTIAFNNQLMEWNLTDIIYKVAIILIALGCEMFLLHPTKTLFIKTKTMTEQLDHTWKNTLYLLSYPLFVVIMIGLRPELIIFLFLFAFYIIACLYVKQLFISDQFLKAEKEKNNKLKLYSNVLEQAPLSVVITDTYGNIEYVNPFFTVNTGYSLKEIMGKNPRILKSTKTPKSTFDSLWESLTKGEKWIGEFINIDKYGEEFQERAVISPIIGEDGKVDYYVAIKENITESLKMKNIIDNQSQFIIQLADVIPNSIFQVSKDGIFLGANQEFRRVYHVDTTKYQGMRMDETPWMNPLKYQIFQEMSEESIATGKPVVRQLSRVIDGQETPVLYIVNAYYHSDGALGGFIGMMTDISELKEKEEELQAAVKRANAATEAKSLFLANMSHEIRTPMNAVIGMAYLALKTDLNEKQRDYLTKISNASSSLLGIINDILDYSKIESGKIKLENVEFNLDQVISKSIELLVQKAREKDIEFISHISCDIPLKLKGDPLRLGQVITNLVSNAVKFTESGEVRIEVNPESVMESRIYLKFEIIDTGVGISKENQTNLFDAFSQADNSITRQFGGTGLGLAICRNIVEMMGGQIWVESEVNKGSVFSFTAGFDLVNVDNHQMKQSIQSIKGLRTLIVDDNSASREILLENIQYIGLDAEVAESGIQAIDIIKSNAMKNPFDLLFVDWKMPRLDGVETVKKISAMDNLRQKPSVVLVTAYDTEEMKRYAEGVKIDAYLSKPVSQSSLHDAIVNIFADRVKASPESARKENNYGIKGTKILLVEDNEINQQIACELLESQGCEVDIAVSGVEAVERIKANPFKYEIILMDIQMPEMDGFEATLNIRNMPNDTQIIAMTARTMLEEKENCFKIGMNDHVSKPIDPDVLLSAVTRWKKYKQKNTYVYKENMDELVVIENTVQNIPTKENIGDSDIERKEELVKTIGRLLELLESGDVTAVEYFEGKRSVLEMGLERKKFEKLLSRITQFEFDDVISILRDFEKGGE